MTKDKPAPRRKQTERRAEAEEKLISAATELIAKRGFEGLRLAELGEMTGFSRALPAHYWGYKEVLVGVIVRRIIDNYQLNLSREPSDAPGLSHVVALVESYIRAMGNNHTNFLALHAIFGSAPTNPALLETVSALNEASIQNIKGSLDTGIQLGEIAADVNTHDEAVALLAFLRGLGSMHLVDRKLPIEQIAHGYLDGMRARLAPKG